MAIIVTKKEAWQEILFYFSLILLIGAIVCYFAFYSFLKNASRTLEDLEKQIQQTKTSEIKSVEGKVLRYQKEIEDFSILFSDHKYISKFFDYFESICHPKIWFSDFNLDTKNLTVGLTGRAENFKILGQQTLFLRTKKEIKNFDLSNIGLTSDGKVEFNLRLSLEPKLFQ